MTLTIFCIIVGMVAALVTVAFQVATNDVTVIIEK